jgi:hypothetical protein
MSALRIHAALLAALAALAPAVAAAQEPRPARVVVAVVDQLGNPIPDARVDVAGLRWAAHTNRDGVARVDRVPPGGRVIAVSRLGYAPERLLIDLQEGEEVSRTVTLAAEAVNLSGVTVRGARRDRALDRNGFYDRERRGFGAFMTAERIDQIRPLRSYELLRYMRGFAVTIDRRGNPVVATTRGPSSLGMGSCAPIVFLDGMQVSSRASNAVESLDLAPPDMIAGIEAFAGPASIPAEYNPTGAACGVILVWTKTGRF